jgi:sialate O-acetylesterase
MMNIRKLYKGVLVAIFLMGMLITDVVAGDLSLHPLFTSHMVLQRNMPVAIYGQANPGERISVTFAGQRKSATTSYDGGWKVLLEPMPASFKPETLTVSVSHGGEKISINDILIGDVWLCSGQSNMDRPINQYSVLTEMLKEVHETSVRIISIAEVRSETKQDEPEIYKTFNKCWQECGGKYLQEFSPTAYFFGKKLQEELKVPIGLIESARGGSRIEAWIPKETLEQSGKSVKTIVDRKNKLTHQSPSGLYNGMIHPIKDFTFKGIIWYQGEANTRKPMPYTDLFPAMIKSWRAKFKRGDMPFYYAQLSSYMPTWAVKGSSPWAWLREAQTKALKLPNTAMAVTIDLGEYEDIHPQNKQPVGNRLALAALNDAGKKVLVSGPMFKQMKIRWGKCHIKFDHISGGLVTKRVVMNKKRDLPFGEDTEAFVADAGTLEGFTICGKDRQFVKAQAKIIDEKVVVWSPEVKKPIAVRYGWADFALCNLYNQEGLPAVPFRTDLFLPPVFVIQPELNSL